MDDLSRSHTLDKFSFGIILALGFLLPVFFLPIAGLPLDVGKSVLVAGLALVAFSLWLLGRLIDGTFALPKNPIIAGGLLLLLATLISSFFSASFSASFIGQGFELGTVAFLLVSFLLFFLSSIFFQTGERVFSFYGALLTAAALTALYHLIRLFTGADALSFGIFENAAATFVGKWNDLAILFGGIALLSLVSLELLSLNRRMSIVLYAALAVSLFFLALINFPLAWLVTSIAAVILVVYGVYMNRQLMGGESTTPAISIRSVKLSIVPLAVAIVSLAFFLGSASFGAYLSNTFGISQLEVRPSLGATFEIARDTLSSAGKLLFGSGPNRFATEWLMHKPDGINQSIFWNTDFGAGFGIVPTALITTGLLGFLGWLAFLGSFLYVGGKALLSFTLSRPSRYLVVSSFLFAAYLWAFVVFYVPSTALYALAFIVTGILVAALTNENLSGNYTLNLLGSPKTGFLSVLVLIFLLIGSATLGYLYTEKFASLVYFQKSLAALNQEGSVEKTEAYLAKATGWSENDIYYRAASELNLIKLNNLLQRSSVPQDTLRAEFQTLLAAAIESAKKATEIDRTNYANFVSLGRVYEAIVPLNIEGAYEAAKDSYNQALALNPESPAILLTMARLEAARNNMKEARAFIEQALVKKSNYTEAVFFLAQIEAQEGNIRQAIVRTEEASLLAPNDISVFFQLGLLKYNDRDFAGAVIAFERAIALSPNYSNAKYFLGLSYQRIGRNDDAIKEFEDIEVLNPDNAEVKSILSNLRAGRAPFADTPPPDNAPEKRPKPPIEE